jgi:Fur family ferric uptake transcriptional regulator
MVDYPFLLDEFTQLLKKNKLKFTKQREAILRVLYENEGHFSPEDIHRLVSEQNPDLNVGIATIYRTLTLLEEASLAESISFGKDGKKYEIGLKKHHDHLVCTECGAIIEFTDDVIETRQEAIAEQHHFQMTDHTMKIVGLCAQCQRKHH